jgi:hypothetical protein
MTFSFNPMLTNSAAGLFLATTDGLVQGAVMDDPAARYQLAGGILALTETLPMWGGVGIQEDIPFNNNLTGLGPSLQRATTLANLTGFSTFNQAHAWISSPQSECPSAGVSMTVPFYRFGSNARLAVACAPSLVSLEGGLVTQQVSWDFNAQQLIPYAPVEAANVITAMSWANTNGGTVTATTTTAHGYVAGNVVTISGVVPTAYNGDVTLIAGTTGSTLVYLLPLASTPGAVTTQGQVLAGGGALPVRVLMVQVGNSKVVSYDAVNNLVHWTPNGTAALILL